MSTPVATDPADRALAALRALVKLFLPQLVYWIVHEYRVVASDGVTFSGQPTDGFSPQLPTNVPYAPALAGTSCVVPAGTLAYVGFANADSSKPYLVRFGNGATSSVTAIDATSEVDVGASASKVVLANASTVLTSPATAATQRRVVCYGDTLSVGSSSGPITLVSASCSKVSA
jgi:hypothetical protein